MGGLFGVVSDKNCAKLFFTEQIIIPSRNGECRDGSLRGWAVSATRSTVSARPVQVPFCRDEYTGDAGADGDRAIDDGLLNH